MMSQTPIKIFSGSSHPELAKEIAKLLRVGVADMQITRFACNEVYVRPEKTVRGCDAFIVQTAT